MKLNSKICVWAVLAVGFAATLSSCEQEYYKEELYRKEIYLVSGENNIAGQEFSFGGDVGYLSIYASGTTAIEHDVTVGLTKDFDAIGEYNKRNYDQDFNKYAVELPASNYTIQDMNIVLKAGSSLPYTLCPIEVNIDNLLPDQTYFIPLRIYSVSDYMASLSRDYVLFRVFMMNDYATTKTSTYYNLNGTSRQGNMNGDVFTPTASPQVISSTKLTIPIAKSAVRIMPAARASSKLEEIINWGVRVTVYPDQLVDVPVFEEGTATGEFIQRELVVLAPYTNSQNAVEVRAIADQPSTYDSETKRFYLNYRYKLASESNWFEVSETLTRANYQSQK